MPDKRQLPDSFLIRTHGFHVDPSGQEPTVCFTTASLPVLIHTTIGNSLYRIAVLVKGKVVINIIRSVWRWDKLAIC